MIFITGQLSSQDNHHHDQLLSSLSQGPCWPSQNVFLKMYFSKCSSQNVFLKLYFSNCTSKNIFLKLYFSNCISQNVFLKMYFSKRTSQNVFLKNVFLKMYFPTCIRSQLCCSTIDNKDTKYSAAIPLVEHVTA